MDSSISQVKDVLSEEMGNRTFYFGKSIIFEPFIEAVEATNRKLISGTEVNVEKLISAIAGISLKTRSGFEFLHADEKLKKNCFWIKMKH